MFRVTVPSNTFYVTPEQLPRFLANIAETKYVNEAGEFLQTTTHHSLVTDCTTATLLIKQPIKATEDARDQFQGLWLDLRNKNTELEEKLRKTQERLKKDRKTKKRK